MINNPLEGGYDYNLGIDLQIIDYIKESTEIESRISPFKAYLLFQNFSGSNVGSSVIPIVISNYSETIPNYRTIIWASGSNYPDIRPYTNEGEGSIIVNIDAVKAVRVLEVEDLVNNNEYAVVRRKDMIPNRVELVFNKGFDASLHVIDYYYTTMNIGINVERVKTGEDISETKFGWTQYINNSYDSFRGKHQVLLRLPLVTRDLIVNEEGVVTLETNDSWMVASPYVRDFDIFILPPDQSITGKEERYEIVNKRDSVIQGELITQRFKLNRIEETDVRCKLPYRRS